MQKKMLWLMSLLLTLSLLLTACGAPAAAPASSEAAPAESSGDAAGEKVLIVAVDGDVDTFDPCCTVGTKTSQTAIQNTI